MGVRFIVSLTSSLVTEGFAARSSIFNNFLPRHEQQISFYVEFMLNVSYSLISRGNSIWSLSQACMRPHGWRTLFILCCLIWLESVLSYFAYQTNDFKQSGNGLNVFAVVPDVRDSGRGGWCRRRHGSSGDDCLRIGSLQTLQLISQWKIDKIDWIIWRRSIKRIFPNSIKRNGYSLL